MRNPPPRALILDFDGTMLDTETAVYEAWREFYEREGQHLSVQDWLGAVGYVNGFDPRAHLEKLTGRGFHWPDHVRDAGCGQGLLERLGLRDFFQVVRTRETVKNHKPAPDVYLGALEDLGVEDPAGSIAFEDSEPGVRAAKAAGLHVVAVPHHLTQHQDLSLADETRETLDGYELPE